MNSNFKMELLMPAGSPRKMSLALAYGADAVYFGPPLFSLRARENDFTVEQMRTSLAEVKKFGAKGYMTLNVFARNRKLKSFREAIPLYKELGVDALIVADPGLACIIRELWPEAEIHLSVQANCMNYEAVRFWHKSLGITRVILSRELSLIEIAETKQRVPEVELEAFVHGSICIAYSGRCLLSSYMSHRDANQGVCDNTCREKFKVHTKEVYIEDMRDPGSIYPVEEDENGTYIMNAKDLCVIPYLEKLQKIGISSLKVEGRTKSETYVSIVTRAYRGALNDLYEGRPYDSKWMREIEKLGNRGFHTGFMIHDPGHEGQNYNSSFSHSADYKFSGLILDVKPLDNDEYNVAVDIKNKMTVGQVVEITPLNGDTYNARILAMTGSRGERKSELHSGMGSWTLRISSDKEIKPLSWIGYGTPGTVAKAVLQSSI